jgi:TRAP transporter 4TM/12TM fusion protein
MEYVDVDGKKKTPYIIHRTSLGCYERTLAYLLEEVRRRAAHLDGAGAGAHLCRVIYTMFYGTSGVMSTPVNVCAKFIAVFIIFGAFLERTGISNFFIDLANSLVGSAAGGPAKVAVISSALCGMVSGSSVGNTVTTGSVTIPMMKKTGYKPEFAGAVEAASSTGGQIMPPIMGAAAFLMAEYMGVSYGQVTLWAILPAILYFTGIFIAVHLEAKKLGLEGIPRSQLPNFWKLQRNVYLLLPLVLLIWLVTANIRSLQFSASIAIILTIVVSLPAAISESREAGNSGWKLVGDVFVSRLKMIFNSLEAGGRGCITVAVACSMAGMIAGCITVTGLASKLIGAVVAISSPSPTPTLPYSSPCSSPCCAASCWAWACPPPRTTASWPPPARPSL